MNKNNIQSTSEGINVVILYSIAVHYVIGMLKALKKCGDNIDIDVVSWDRKGINSSQYLIEKVEGVQFHARSSLTDENLLALLRSRRPDIIYVSGWMDKGYLRAIRRYRAEGGRGRVVCGIDDQWEGRLRQRLGQVYFRLFYKNLYDFMWVAGKPQYHFAQRFGYGQERILCNMLSADTAVFNKKSDFSRRFVFVGRFDPLKGVDLLIDAYSALPEETKSQWPLVLIGDGELKREIEKRNSKHIVVKPFMQLPALVEELMKGGVACMPSHHEQWGVAIHEMASLGYPLILSSACGAATEFLITGYNGFLFRRGDVKSLRDALMQMSFLSTEELEAFALRSRILGQRITSEHAACSLLSVLKLEKI
ncbi:MAG: glycosyltransferase family 4 protein [Syntrophobacteraceae bacterium]